MIIPKSLTLELPAAVKCPVGCSHCSHRSAYTGNRFKMDIDSSMRLIDQAAEMGITSFVAYPRQGDVSLESEQYIQLFSHAQSMGMRTKTTSSCVNPESLLCLTQYLDQLTISIDGLDSASFLRFRPAWLLEHINRFLDQMRQKRPDNLFLAVNVVATKSFINSGGISELTSKIVAMNIFNKLNFLEILPGPDGGYEEERLESNELKELIALKAGLKKEIKITVPVWEPGRPGTPSCPLGRDFIVIGPDGGVAACVLLLHGGQIETNVFKETSLAAVWKKITMSAYSKKSREYLFSAPAAFPHSVDIGKCHDCGYFKSNRCYGGCVARARMFGHDFERKRQCRGPWD